VKALFRILLVIFVLQSTWAVAAQYCQHEENPTVNHIGHHTHKHFSQTENGSNLIDQTSSDSSKLDIDNDCSYCHFSMNTLPVFVDEIEPLAMVAMHYSYPEVIPSKPERPNWNLAV